MLGAGVSEIKQASAKILALEPIPSRSFASSEPIAYIVPDAAFSVEQSRVTIELNRRVFAPPFGQHRILCAACYFR